MPDTFRIESTPRSLATYGPVPLKHFDQLLARAESTLERFGDEHNEIVCDAVIAQHLGASLVFVRRGQSGAWRTKLGIVQAP